MSRSAQPSWKAVGLRNAVYQREVNFYRTVAGQGLAPVAAIYACECPDGRVFTGQSFFEMMSNGRYDGYGFTGDWPPKWLNMYHLMDQ